LKWLEQESSRKITRTTSLTRENFNRKRKSTKKNKA